jgi:chaperone modulatory protein CbpM
VGDVIELREVRLLDDADWIAATELCRLCRLDLDAVIELADLGLVAPRGYSPGEWQLPAAALPRLAMAGRLMRDLGVNVSGAALAVELLEAQRNLERQVRRLERLAVETR